MIRSPSRALTLARRAAVRSALAPKESGRHTDHQPSDVVREYRAIRPPGHVEKALQVLGVTDPQHVRCAQDIDLAADHLLTRASAGRDHPAPAHRAQLAASVRDAPRRACGPGGHRDVTVPRPAASALRDSPERQAE